MNEDVLRLDLEEVLEELWQLVLAGDALEQDTQPLLLEARALSAHLGKETHGMLAEITREFETLGLTPTDSTSVARTI